MPKKGKKFDRKKDKLPENKPFGKIVGIDGHNVGDKFTYHKEEYVVDYFTKKNEVFGVKTEVINPILESEKKTGKPSKRDFKKTEVCLVSIRDENFVWLPK